MNDLTKMEKVVLLLTFWFAPDNPLKSLEWLAFNRGDTAEELNEDNVLAILANVADGDDYVDWEALDAFKEDMQRSMH